MFEVRRALFGMKPNSVALRRTSLGIWDCYPVSGDFVKRLFSSKEVEDECIEDFNKELELVFGSRPESPSPLGGQQTSRVDLKSEDLQQDVLTSHHAKNSFKVNSLSHVDTAGKASMVNVVNKTDTKRVAVASGMVFLGSVAFNLVAANNIAKGDVLTVAKIAGIHGAKQTSSLIPLCHNILLSGVDVTLTLNNELHAIEIKAEATASGPTGVEMEALTAVSIASLTVYDMCKAVAKEIRISNVQLESKTGGKSGDWYR
ncbi:unnamed protein product [Calypogeia fissa]